VKLWEGANDNGFLILYEEEQKAVIVRIEFRGHSFRLASGCFRFLGFRGVTSISAQVFLGSAPLLAVNEGRDLWGVLRG